MPRLALIKIINNNPQLAKNEQTSWHLKSMLADDCPKTEDKRYVNAILMARSHIVAQMVGSQGLESVDILLPRLTRQLVDFTGLQDAVAAWAVSVWAEALGIVENWQPTAMKIPILREEQERQERKFLEQYKQAFDETKTASTEECRREILSCSGEIVTRDISQHDTDTQDKERREKQIALLLGQIIGVGGRLSSQFTTIGGAIASQITIISGE